jgi:NitT/TauT family transport system substrate-binding protein
MTTGLSVSRWLARMAVIAKSAMAIGGGFWFCTVAAAAASILPLAGARADDGKLTDIVFANASMTISLSAGFIAEDLGIFKKNGLNVKVVLIQGVGATNAVIAGSADFVEGSATSITRAAAHGQRLLAIAETLKRPGVQVVLRKAIAEAGHFDAKAPFDKRAALLRGHLIAIDAVGSQINGFLMLSLKRAGIDLKSMQTPIMAAPNMVAAFQAKQIDGFTMPPPWSLIPITEGTATLIISGPDGDPPGFDPFASSVIATRPETCRDRRPLCVAFGHSFVEAESFLHDHPAEALAVVKKRFPTLDNKVLAASFETIRRISPNPPFVSKEGMENGEALNVEAGLMKPEEKLKSYDGLLTNEFVQ